MRLFPGSFSCGSAPFRKAVPLLHMLLVFGHLLATSMALGAIVATDLRLLSKLSQDKVRIAPPNPFVARIVMLALLLLYVTGGAIILQGVIDRPDYLDNPKLQAKIGLVIVLTLNAFVLHHVTFPRLARGRRVPRWTVIDWIVIAVPVATSNFLWMFCAFLGIARPWNHVVPLRDVLEIAAALYLFVQLAVVTILAMAGRNPRPDHSGWADRLARSLATVGSLGRVAPLDAAGKPSRRSGSRDEAANASRPGSSLPASEVPLEAARPALQLVGSRPSSRGRRSAR
jgi:hypothetical protein